jgi:hypothetical protein
MTTTRVTYQDLGIPERYLFDSFHYVPSGNIGVAVFYREAKPSVNRIFWRRSNERGYSLIPVREDNYSLDSCLPASASCNLYYLVMEWRKIGPEPHQVGGYWVSLNRFNLDSGREEVLLTQEDFVALSGGEGSWISKILHVSPDENEIDIVAGINNPPDNHARMDYGVHRIHLAPKSLASRLPLPAVFI